MNIAILIGISSYQHQEDLPACSLDAEHMRHLLIATQKYDDIQLVTDKTNSSQVKDALRSFFTKHQSSGPIEEAFVYFSGHGVYQKDALLCCSDFDGNRPATTSISNNELDDLLRSVNPEVAVKVLDACQSGSPYIKNADSGFEKALGRSALDAFICMASSRQDQSSYASASESFFTSRWIESALEKAEGSILYRDIQAALADAFVSSPNQTPYFINQGTGLEIFASETEAMKKMRSERAKRMSSGKPHFELEHLIQAKVQELDQQFVAHEKALKAISACKSALEKCQIHDEIVSKFYEVSASFEGTLESIPKSRAVASFAEENSWQKRYFVKVKQEAYKVRSLKDPLARLGMSYFSRHGDEDYVIETKYRPGSLEATESLPLEVAELAFNSSHPSLVSFAVYIGLVHSLTEVMVLSSAVRFTQKGWEKREPELADLQWRFQSYQWTDVVENPGIIASDAQKRAESDIRKYLESLTRQLGDSAESGEGEEKESTDAPAA